MLPSKRETHVKVTSALTIQCLVNLTRAVLWVTVWYFVELKWEVNLAS